MKEAARLVGSLTSQLGGEFEFEVHWWNFKRLSRVSAINWAAQVALHAQMIICSVHAANTVPLPCRLWIEWWRREKQGQNSALVALLGNADAPAFEPSPAELYLRKVARVAGMDFFAKEYRLRKEPSTAMWQSPLPLAVPPEACRPPAPPAPRWWGINE